MEALGPLSVVGVIFLIILAILILLMPFFVLRIRNEMIKLNKNMERVVDLLGDIAPTPITKQSAPIMTKCHWCKQTFPKDEANVLEGETLCPICWRQAKEHEQNQT